MTTILPGEKLSLDLFDYSLPPELIAQEPARPRDSSRLLVVDREDSPLEHRRFMDLPSLLKKGDLLLVNRTRVIPARLKVARPSGANAEVLLTRPLDGDISTARRWEAIAKPAKSFKAGKEFTVGEDIVFKAVGRGDGGTVIIESEGAFWDILTLHGEVPLPPYIERKEGPQAADENDYQTYFAQEPGAVAAPTASLHFTSRVISELEESGVELEELILHVGPGTFLPVREEFHDDVRGHQMHSEYYEIPPETLDAIRRTRQNGGRVIPVGTTSLRALETWAHSGDAQGDSKIFIYPGFEFKMTDALITNFHLPHSTLLMLVSAFSTHERIMKAYEEAVNEKYRFFSYGDAMLLI